MRSLSIVICVFCFSNNFAQTSVLTGFKNGSWALLDTNGNILTTTEYHYIHSFDQRNTSYFMKDGLYGIIGSDGKERLSASYIDIVQHGFGIYSVRNEDTWKLVRADEKPEVLFDTLRELPEVLGNNWIVLNDSLRQSIVNLQSGTSIPKEKNAIITLNNAEFLGLTQDSLILVFHPDGTKIKTIIGSLYQYDRRFLVLADTNFVHTIIDEDGIWQLPFTVTSFYVSYKTVFCGNENFGVLYDLATKATIFQGPYSNIYIHDDNYFGVSGINGANLVDKSTKKTLLPNKLSYFLEGEKSFYVYHQNGTMALLTKEGQFMLPGFYDKIQQNKELINVSLNGNNGLYSLRKKGYILPMIYLNISNQKNNRYKAVTEEAFTIVEINDKHEITRRIDGSNTVRIRTATAPAGKKRIFDPRLFPLGWYVDSTEIEVKGEMKIRYLWGLKDGLDSTILKPKYPDLSYIIGPYSLQVNPAKPVLISDGSKRNLKTYEFVDWEEGKKIPNLICTYIDSNDFSTQSWTKFKTSTRTGIIDTEGEIRYFTYLSGRNFPYTRYCDAEKWANSPTVTDTSFYQTTSDFQTYEFVSNKNRYVAVKGKWNFIKPDGTDLFKEPFQFVEEFVGTTAIAKKNGKWGVITKDTILIPFKFKKISRQIIGGDTLFITDETPEISRYFDNQLHEIPAIKNATAKSENLLLIDQNGSQHLMNQEREILAEKVKNMKVMPSGYFKAKIEKEMVILDSAGITVATSTYDVIDILLNQFCLTEKNGKYGLADFSNNLLLAEENKSIQAVGNFILAENGLFCLYNNDLEMVMKSEFPIWVDPFTNTIAATKKRHTFIYHGTRKIAKLKNVEPVNYWNQLIWTKSKENSFGISLKGDTIIRSENIKEFQRLPNNWLALQSEKGVWSFYENDWTMINTPGSSRKFTYIGPDYLALLTKKNKWLIWSQSSEDSIEVDAVMGEFQSELCLVRTGPSFYYLTKNLKPVNNLRYTSASPFHKGYAAVCDARGGTLINSSFKPMTYPSYTGLNYLAANVYKASPQDLHNIYRMDGNPVLQHSVQQFAFINERIIKIIDQGEVHYVKSNGTPLF